MIGRIKKAMLAENYKNGILSVSFGSATKSSSAQDIYNVFSEAENAMYQRKLQESSTMRSKTIQVIAHSLFSSNKEEEAHNHRVGELCREIARAMDLDQETTNDIATAGFFHERRHIRIGSIPFHYIAGEAGGIRIGKGSAVRVEIAACAACGAGCIISAGEAADFGVCFAACHVSDGKAVLDILSAAGTRKSANSSAVTAGSTSQRIAVCYFITLYIISDKSANTSAVSTGIISGGIAVCYFKIGCARIVRLINPYQSANAGCVSAGSISGGIAVHDCLYVKTAAS